MKLKNVAYEQHDQHVTYKGPAGDIPPGVVVNIEDGAAAHLFKTFPGAFEIVPEVDPERPAERRPLVKPRRNL